MRSLVFVSCALVLAACPASEHGAVVGNADPCAFGGLRMYPPARAAVAATANDLALVAYERN